MFSIRLKIINQSTIKVGSLCMNNFRRVIFNHSQRILGIKKSTHCTNLCNCRVKSRCPLDGRCLTENIVYRATITTNNEEEYKEYIGMTAGPFKTRYYNHMKSLNNMRYKDDTELSKFAWNQKKKGNYFKIKWSILKKVPASAAFSRTCCLCNTEKIFIMMADKERLLNKRC